MYTQQLLGHRLPCLFPSPWKLNSDVTHNITTDCTTTTTTIKTNNPSYHHRLSYALSIISRGYSSCLAMIHDHKRESLQAQPRSRSRSQARIGDWLSDLPLPPSPSLYRVCEADKKHKRLHDPGYGDPQVKRQCRSGLLPATSPPASHFHTRSQASTPRLLHGSMMAGAPPPLPPPPSTPRPTSKKRKIPAGGVFAVSNLQDSDDELNMSQPVFSGAAAKDGMGDNIIDLTPRPSRSRSWKEAESQSPSQSQAHSRTSTTTSGKSSPRKGLHALRIDAGGLEVRPLTTMARHMPHPLKKLNSDMETAGSGYGVVDPTLFHAAGQKLPSASVLPPWAFAPEPAARARLGPTPNLHQVGEIVSDAAHAQHLGYLEDEWNCTVHTPLLKLALDVGCLNDDDDEDEEASDREDDGHQQQPKGAAMVCNRITSRITPLGVDFVPCTTAKIIKEYILTAAPAKMIDFAIVLGMANLGPGDKRRIEQLCAGAPLGSINHTDFAPLMSHPIAVSIETKKPGKSGGDNDAQLQVGVWQASQWKQLQYLVCGAAALRSRGEEDHDGVDSA